MAPYVGLYFLGQMFLWWPLWDLARGAWAAFGVLFVAEHRPQPARATRSGDRRQRR